MCTADEPDDEANEAEQQAQLQAEVEDMFELEGEQQYCNLYSSSMLRLAMVCRRSWLTC